MTTGIDGLKRSEQETNLWLNALENRLETNRRQAITALRATLHAVRDRIGADNALHLAAQLPLLIKGIFFENWRPSETPNREREKETFLANVDAGAFRGLRIEPEQALRLVLEVVAERIDPHEIAKLRGRFPENMQDLWPEVAPDRAAAMRRRARRPGGDRQARSRRGSEERLH